MDHVQDCPCCHSTSVIRNDVPYKRNVRHSAAFDKSVDLRIPAIHLACKACGATYTWEYSFVEPKKKYTKAYAAYLARQTYGATVAHTSREQQVPYSTMERIFKRDLHVKSADIQEQVLKTRKGSQPLVM